MSHREQTASASRYCVGDIHRAGVAKLLKRDVDLTIDSNRHRYRFFEKVLLLHAHMVGLSLSMAAS